MTEYTITIDNFETGLTKEAVEAMYEDSFEQFEQDLEITVEESE